MVVASAAQQIEVGGCGRRGGGLRRWRPVWVRGGGVGVWWGLPRLGVLPAVRSPGVWVGRGTGVGSGRRRRVEVGGSRSASGGGGGLAAAAAQRREPDAGLRAPGGWGLRADLEWLRQIEGSCADDLEGSRARAANFWRAQHVCGGKSMARGGEN